MCIRDRVRTVTDTRDTDGSAVTEVYAEAEFYDLTFSVRTEERTFEAEYPETEMCIRDRDGSTGGFFADNTNAAQQVWNTVNLLLRLDRNWCV